MKINDAHLPFHLLESLKGDAGTGQRKKEPPLNNPDTALHKFLSGLDSNLRQEITRTWIKYNLPLDLNYLKQLLSFLENTGSGKRTSPRIQAFGFLLKNNLPLLPSLIDGLGRHLDFSRSITSELTNPALKDILINHIGNSGDKTSDIPGITPQKSLLPAESGSEENKSMENRSLENGSGGNRSGENIAEGDRSVGNRPATETISQADGSVRETITPLKNSPLTFTIAGKLITHSNLPPEELARVLAEYPSALRTVITALKQDAETGYPGLENRLLAQQLLNSRPEGLLLSLEIPVFLPRKKELVPAYLQVWQKDDDGPEDEEAKARNPVYKICFFITLPQRGTVRADLVYRPGRLKSSFKSSNPGTEGLIRKELPALRKRLTGLGLALEEASVGPLKEAETDLEEEFIKPLLGTADTEKITGLTHLDLRI